MDSRDAVSKINRYFRTSAAERDSTAPLEPPVSWEQGEVGNWINMPMFNGLLGARYAVRGDDGRAMDVAEFLELAERVSQPIQWFQEPLATPPAEMPQGPPCLQHLIQIGFPPGTRNQGLFNLGLYYKKADPDHWETALEEANAKYLTPPLPTDEVSTILKSLRKKSYNYRCNEQPIAAHCNARLCRSRKFGVGAGKGTLDSRYTPECRSCRSTFQVYASLLQENLAHVEPA